MRCRDAPPIYNYRSAPTADKGEVSALSVFFPTAGITAIMLRQVDFNKANLLVIPVGIGAL